MAKYSGIASRHGFDRDRSFLVCVNGAGLDVEFLNATSDIQIVGVDDFEDVFRKVFGNDLPKAREIPSEFVPEDSQAEDAEPYVRQAFARIRERVAGELAAMESRLLEAIDEEERRLLDMHAQRTEMRTLQHAEGVGSCDRADRDDAVALE